MRGTLFAFVAICLSSLTSPFSHAAPAAPTTQPSAKPLVVLVTRGDYFLEHAVRNLKGVRSEVVTPAQYEAAAPSRADSIIFEGYQPKRLPPATGVVLFDAVPPGMNLTQDNAAKPAHVGKEQVKDWMRNDSLLSGTDLKKIFVADALELKNVNGWDVLVTGDKSPLIVRRTIDGRRVVVVGFDILKSNWPLEASFPQFLNRVLSEPVKR